MKHLALALLLALARPAFAGEAPQWVPGWRERPEAFALLGSRSTAGAAAELGPARVEAAEFLRGTAHDRAHALADGTVFATITPGTEFVARASASLESRAGSQRLNGEALGWLALDARMALGKRADVLRLTWALGFGRVYEGPWLRVEHLELTWRVNGWAAAQWFITGRLEGTPDDPFPGGLLGYRVLDAQLGARALLTPEPRIVLVLGLWADYRATHRPTSERWALGWALGVAFLSR